MVFRHDERASRVGAIPAVNQVQQSPLLRPAERMPDDQHTARL
jgi:hypothetical protein